MVTGPLPDASAQHWRACFIPEARGMRQPVVSAGEPRLNYATSPLELTSRATISVVGSKAMCRLIKLLQYDWTGSLDTFLTKFQHMAGYLWCDDEDMFHHLCASLEGAAGQIRWDISPRVPMADIICLLQTRIGTQLQAECFKVELCDRRRAPGESL